MLSVSLLLGVIVYGSFENLELLNIARGCPCFINTTEHANKYVLEVSNFAFAGAASRLRPEGRQRQADSGMPTTRVERQANCGPKAYSGKPTAACRQPEWSGKPTAAGRPTAARRLPVGSGNADSGPKAYGGKTDCPEGSGKADSGPKANCGKADSPF